MSVNAAFLSQCQQFQSIQRLPCPRLLFVHTNSRPTACFLAISFLFKCFFEIIVSFNDFWSVRGRSSSRQWYGTQMEGPPQNRGVMWRCDKRRCPKPPTVPYRFRAVSVNSVFQSQRQQFFAPFSDKCVFQFTLPTCLTPPTVRLHAACC